MKTWKVPDMHCGRCVARIEEGLRAAGISGTVDLATQTVTIDEAAEEAARAVLDDLGFEPEAC